MSDNKPKKPKKVQVAFRCDEDLDTAFTLIAEQNGFSKSLVLRELMKRYIQKEGQMDLFK